MSAIRYLYRKCSASIRVCFKSWPPKLWFEIEKDSQEGDVELWVPSNNEVQPKRIYVKELQSLDNTLKGSEYRSEARGQ